MVEKNKLIHNNYLYEHYKDASDYFKHLELLNKQQFNSELFTKVYLTIHLRFIHYQKGYPRALKYFTKPCSAIIPFSVSISTAV